MPEEPESGSPEPSAPSGSTEETEAHTRTADPSSTNGRGATDPQDGEREEMVRMTLGEHLNELRSRLIRIVLLFIGAFIIAFFFQDELVRFIMQPYYRVKGAGEKLLGTEAQAAFIFTIKICGLSALFVTVPLAVHQLWSFIAAGLYKHERRYIRVFFPMSMGLFLAGMTLGYTMLVPYGLEFLINYGEEFVQMRPTPANYLTILVILTLVLGAVFQLPLVMMFFAKIGLVTPETYRAKRRYFILGAFIGAALLTPPDPITQSLLAIPTLFLYEFGILLSKWNFAPKPPPSS